LKYISVFVIIGENNWKAMCMYDNEMDEWDVMIIFVCICIEIAVFAALMIYPHFKNWMEKAEKERCRKRHPPYRPNYPTPYNPSRP
jgi:hypothetical protein